MSAPIWTTPAGLLGVCPVSVFRLISVTAEPVLPAVAVSYQIISGIIPAGMTFNSAGGISGIPAVETSNTTSTFVVRATDNLGNIADRTFSIQISGAPVPVFTTPEGELGPLQDSIWFEQAITYTNPIPTNPVSIRVLQGSLPPGLEINEYGLIRGYPEPPVNLVALPQLTSAATATDENNNSITVVGTDEFTVNRPIVFTGTSMGGLVSGTVYYIKEIINSTQLTITTIIGGDTFLVNTASGYMDVTLPATTEGQPSKRQYNFTLILSSPLGNDFGSYRITVFNQNLPINQGGLGLPLNTRDPALYNTRPQTYQIESLPDYRYYVLPPDSAVSVPGETYPPAEDAYIGQFLADNFFAFKIIGHDFDSQEVTYVFNELPSWLTGNPNTGWVYGTPDSSVVPLNQIKEFSFVVAVQKKSSSAYQSPITNFSFRIANNITGDITWISDSDLGSIYNATESNKRVLATSDVGLIYEKISGTLPPNLEFKSNGTIDGIVSYQPGTNYRQLNTETDYTFTIRAKSADPTLAPLINSTKTFTLTVVQEYDIPTDDLYIKCTPSIADRNLIRTLLDDPILIPDEYIYRIDDINYGKAQNVTYAHAYGIYSSDIEEYIEAVKKNHYWRNITLGELNTAIARDENNNIIYEVLYSTVIDNLQKYESAMGEHHSSDYDYRYSESVSEEIFWPRFIDLNLGPWYTSSTEIYTSYIFNQEAKIITNFFEYDLLTQTGIPIIMQQGVPTFYTSLTPGYARILYPNSLENMRKRVGQELGVDYNFRLLPLWMTSQQQNGNTLGFTPAWVIAYTKIPEPITTTATATYDLTSEVQLTSVAGLIVGGKINFTGDSIGNLNRNTTYYVSEINTLTNRVKLSLTQYGTAINLVSGTGSMTAVFDAVSYAQIIKHNIETEWPFTLNKINFQIDRFSVGKELTYDLSTKVVPSSWTRYPSGVPVPDPVDSKDFYVLFPQKTILPNKTQYKL
jgi:hypothetical protein